MNHRNTAVLSTVLAILWLAPAALAGQSASEDPAPVPRTPLGVSPTWKGVWDHGTTTPMERPARHEGREFLTAEEIAEANLNARTFATSERRSELSAQADVGLAYNQFLVGPRAVRWSHGVDYRPSRREDASPRTGGPRTRAGPSRRASTVRLRRPQSVGTVSVARHGTAGWRLQQTTSRSSRVKTTSRFSWRWSTRCGSSRSTAARCPSTAHASGWGVRADTGTETPWWLKPPTSRDKPRGAARAST